MSETVTRREKALAYFGNGFHCSQAVLASWADQCGLSEEQALKLGACFGSGMRNGEVCGAVSGALMVLGAVYGQHDITDAQSRQAANEVNDSMMKTFAEACGSCLCREILGCDPATPEGVRYAREHRLFEERCPQFVACAMDVLEKIIGERNKPWKTE